MQKIKDLFKLFMDSDTNTKSIVITIILTIITCIQPDFLLAIFMFIVLGAFTRFGFFLYEEFFLRKDNDK